MPKVFGGGKQEAKAQAKPEAAKKMFNPEQIAKGVKDYSTTGTSKWNQIMSNMGAGAGTGVNLPEAIQSQAKSMQEQLGGIGEGQYAQGTSINDIMRQLESGMGAKYPVY